MTDKPPFSLDHSQSYWRRQTAVDIPLPELSPESVDDPTFRLLADNLPTLCWIANGDGYIVWYNQRWHDYCGTTPADMEGWGWQKVHDPNILPQVLERWKESISTGHPFEMTFPLRGADGVFRPFLTRIQPIVDVTGRIVRWCGVNTEISEQVTAKEQARAANERVEMALDAGAIVGTWVWDIGRNLLVGDVLFGRTFGIDVDACAKGVPLERALESIHPDDIRRVEATIAAALEGDGKYSCEYRVRRADGQVRWIGANGRVQFDADGNPSRFPGLLMDITGRVVAEGERDRTDALLRTFVNAVPGVVYAKDRQGRLRMANSGTVALIGKPLDAILGKTDAEFLDSIEEARSVMDNDERIMSGGIGEQVEEIVTGPNRIAQIWLSTKEPLRDGAGEVVGLVGTSIDITSRKRIEAELEQLNAKLLGRVDEEVRAREGMMARVHEMQKLETLGQFTGGVAHDFNNLLAPIVGSLDLLSRRHADDQRSQEVVSVALQAAESARAMVQRLLAFARRQNLEAKATDVCALLGGMGDMLTRLLGPQINLSVECSPDIPAIMVDPNQLELAIMNLAVNGRDATPEGGSLSITATVGSEGNPPSAFVCICVKDTGTGMDAETLSRAVEPFYTTKPPGKGTGLGLPSVFGLAQQSGGRFELESCEGVGTAARLYLPVSYEVPENKPLGPATHAFVPRGTGTILLVDDEELVRTTTAAILADGGYDVVQTSSAFKALQLVAEGLCFDALVTDYAMPGMTGVDLADKLREKRPTLPVLIISGYGNAAEKQFSNVSRLDKPFRQADLLKSVNALLTRTQGA